MKKPAALTLAPGAAVAQVQAQAQTSVSIHGIVDGGLVHESGGAGEVDSAGTICNRQAFGRRGAGRPR